MGRFSTITSGDVAPFFETLDRIGCLGVDRSAGYLRAGYSKEESIAMRYIATEAEKAGGRVMWDKIGNLSIEWPGRSEQFVEVGSHLDTVPEGGNRDGVVGIVSGLVAIKNILEAGAELTHGIRLRVWRLEESGTFKKACFGSSAAFGTAPPATLDNTFRGITLRDAIQAQGFSPQVVSEGQRTIEQREVDRILAHLEFHIEQGRILEATRTPIGVVTSIRGPVRVRVIFEGAFDHSGTTPNGHLRRDANEALLTAGARLYELGEKWRMRGHDLVITVPEINNDSSYNRKHPESERHGLSIIAGFAYFHVDFRSASNDTLERFSTALKRSVQRVSKKLGVSVKIEKISNSPALENLDPTVMRVLEEGAGHYDLATLRMPSGAGHDAGIVGQQLRSDGSPIPTGMGFVPCMDGISHDPKEDVSNEEVANGANVLRYTLWAYASGRVT